MTGVSWGEDMLDWFIHESRAQVMQLDLVWSSCLLLYLNASDGLALEYIGCNLVFSGRKQQP